MADHKGSDVESQMEASKQMTIQLSQAQFEKLYLSAGKPAKGDLKARFANPTTLGLVCFCVPLTTLASYLLNFRHTNTSSIHVTVGAFYFVGGLGQTLCGLLEFFIGNTFPFVVFTSFSGLYYSFGWLNDVNSNLVDAFGGATAAETDKAYLNGVALYLTVWTAMLALFTLICIRINVVYCVLFSLITIAVGLMAGAYYKLGDFAVEAANDRLKAAGGFMLASSICGWYLVLSQLLAAEDFFIQLPVGDLSRFLARKKQE